MSDGARAARDSGEEPLLGAARAGDDGAFRSLTEPYRRELHVHCYRMLGSLHDAEDVVQVTLLRAWTGLDSYEGRAPFRAWLYGIATNACLNELARRGRQRPVVQLGPPSDPRTELTLSSPEVAHLEPYPDVLYDELAATAGDPQARYLARETIELAFLTAIQLLPARQRAVLILREVLAFSAAEAAELLDTSVPAVNSALQRARSTLAQHSPAGPQTVGHTSKAGEADLLERFMRAWEQADMAAIATLLREDALLTMPPAPTWFLGRDAIVTWFSTSPYVFGEKTRRIRLLPGRANRQPAFVAYALDPQTGSFESYGVMVLRLAGGLVAEITGFGDARLHRFFDLPERLAG